MTTTIEEQTIEAVLKEKTPFVVGDYFFLLKMFKIKIKI
jgi:hypothetical protein